ncbi:hypothetical protein [Paraburkholderia sp. J8-2]|uniref:hypothetical protein n=1 Tax=Paraburkholderia sp. J8-2 TaxID=2805440 RepID=UPI002AB765D3|nr:hypothetical protein [Paraburkholderia sp. J8-2]
MTKLNQGRPVNSRFDSGTIDRLLACGHANDLSSYARSIGYQGVRRVILMDSKVITHRSMDWVAFCAMCRRAARRTSRINLKQPHAA